MDISLNNWLANIPPGLVEAHLEPSKDTLEAIPKANNAIPPR